jgi:hypothetical protein
MTRPPHAYVVVLDASASMSWNFAGQGTRNGQDIQCGAPADPNVPRAVCGPESPWRVVNERRIYVAKQALMALIDQFGPNDTMRLVAYGDNITTTVDWSSDKTALKQAVLAAGQYNGDPYWTSGRSSNASGLYAARQALALAPPPTPGLMAEPVVIFLTDSVANQLLAADGSPQIYSGADICPTNMFAADTATCMAGYLSDGTPRPITAMVLQGELLKQISTVYVVGLAGVDETGLLLVASASNYPFFSVAIQPTTLAGILDTIHTTILHGDCVPRGGDVWSDMIDVSRIGDVPPVFGGPLGDTVVGYLYLRDQDGNPLPNGRYKIPIRRDPQTDKLSYHVDDLAPGTYRILGFVAYRGDDDVSRVYRLIFERDKQLLSQETSFTLPLPPSGVPGPADLYLDMNGTVCPTP